MALPGELVECVAASLNVPVKTVTQHDRILAAGGLRKVGGRGRSAARVSERDAANLLIAVLGSPVAGPTVKDTVQTVNRYANLVAKKPMSFELAMWPSNLRILQDLPLGHNLRDAISALIKVWAQATPKWPDVFVEVAPAPFQMAGSVNLAIELHGPRPIASIAIEATNMHSELSGDDTNPLDFFPDKVAAELSYHTRIANNSDEEILAEMKKLNREHQGDLKQIRMISEVTISNLAALFTKSPP